MSGDGDVTIKSREKLTATADAVAATGTRIAGRKAATEAAHTAVAAEAAKEAGGAPAFTATMGVVAAALGDAVKHVENAGATTSSAAAQLRDLNSGTAAIDDTGEQQVFDA